MPLAALAGLEEAYGLEEVADVEKDRRHAGQAAGRGAGAGFLMARRSRKRGRRGHIGWFIRRPASGTVYLMQPERDRTLFKLGFTRRRTIERRRELERPGDGRLRIVCTITMPHAPLLEQRLLARMRRGWWIFRRRPSRRGTEWFHLRCGESIADIEALMSWEARRLRLAATVRLSWPWGGRISLFRPPTVLIKPKTSSIRLWFLRDRA